MSRIEKKLKSALAFTLVELLAAAALLSILAGLSFTAVVQYRKELKFMELERSAKELFLAAQNHLTLSELDGSLDRLRENAGSARLGYAGADGTYTVIVSTEETSGNAEDILGLLLPFGAIDDYVRTGGSYLIRYSLPTATVTDVFYADSLLRAPRLGYAFTGGQDLSGTGTLSQELESAKASPASDAARKMRRAFPGGNGSAMLGYYGGSADGVERQLLRTAGLRLVNGAKLYAVVEDSNAPAAGESRTAVTKLHIRGVQSGAEQILELTADGGRRARNVFKAALDNRYLVVLDDISTGSGTDLHFASLFRGGVPGIESSAPLIPGEDIELYTEVSASGKLSNLPRSQTLTVNSLFGARRISRTADGTEALRDITVSDIRHLENLDGTISGFAPESLPAYFMKKEGGVSCVAVQQTADLSFSRFLSENAAIRREWDSSAPEDAELFGIDTAAGRRGNMQPGCFLPLNLSYRLRYDADFSGGAGESGNSSGDGGEKSYERRFYKISDVNIDMGTSRGAEKHAGLFGVVRSDCEISRLLLENFSVKAADIADAGALAGVVETGASLSVNSVLVKSYDLSDYGGTLPDGTDEASRRKRKETLEALEQREIAAADGQAGGLLGESRGALSIENSSASVYVRSERGAAGGLLGAAAGGSLTIERSYTAGHSLNGTYRDTLPGESTEPEKAQGRVNVIAPSETGGGFSGAAGGLLGAVRDVAPFRLHIVYATGSLYGGRYAGGLLGYIDPAQGGTVTNAYAAGISISRREGDGNYVGSLAAQVGDLRFDSAYGILGNTRGGTPVAPGQSGIEELSRGDIRIAGSGTAQGSGRSGNEDRLAYPYDSWLRTRYSAKYSYRTISELLDTETGSAAGSGTLPYFLRHHVGDWEAIDGESTDTLLYFDNAAILTALILQPISEDTEEEKLTLVLSDRTKEAEKERYPIEVKALGSGKPESTVHAQSGKAAPRSRAEVLITGEGEQKQRYLKLSVFLDDITTEDGHFADISSIEPGSDLVGYAYAGEKEAGEQRYERELNELERAALYQALTGEAPDSGTGAESAAHLRRFFGTRKYMHKDETNSLFACSERVDRTALYERKDRPEEERIAYIASLRHLQNLDGRVSELPDGKKTWAEQIEALYVVSKDGRAGFFDEIRNRRGLTASTVLRIYAAGDGKALSATGAFFGIRNESLHCYSGNGHTISDLRLQSAELEGAGDAAALPTEESEAMGFFRYLGDAQPKLEICNLALLDVEARGRHAGALAGLNQSSNQLLLSHVLVENPRIFAEGHAGGMVGYTYSSSNSSLRFEDCIVRSDEARSAAANAETGRMLVVSLGGTGSAEPETDDGIGAAGVSGCAGGFLGVSRGTDLHFQRCLAYGEQAIVLTLGRGGEDSAGGLVGSLVGGRNGSSGVRIRIENGNRLMLHYNAEDRESAFSIRIRGEQSGRTYYLYIDKNPQYKKCWLMDEKGERVGWASQLDTSMVQDADDPNRFRISLDNLSRRAGDFHGVTGGKFYPGENIFISVAKGSENDKVTELAYSPEERYNSLFERVEKLEDGSPNHYKAIISNSRHLENLNERGSSLNRIPPEDLAKFTVVEAEQDCDIIWSDPNWYKSPGERVRLNNKYDPYVQEMEQQKESSSIHWNSWTTVTEKGAFCPLEIDGRLARYDGKGHTIYGLEIAAYSHTGSNTALFASIQRDFVLSDLRIQNITVGSTTNAAALAATVKAGSRLTIRKVSIDNGGSALTLAADNYCGGFVGYSEGTVEITDSALHADRISIRTSKSLSAGALVGRSDLLSIENTRVTADREVQVSGIQNVGGLAGKITESAVLKNSALSAPRLRIRKESTGNSEDSAGGLLGSVSGSLRIEGCAVNSPDARVLSLAQGNAGGLVGTAANIRELLLTDSFTGAAVYTAGSWASANGGLFGSLRLNADAHRAGDSAAAPQIEKSYVSGHTVNGQYGEKTAVPEGPDAEQQGEYYGQIGRKEVGGLLGTVSGGQLELVECFSTASIYNHRAAYRSRSGGLVGEVDGTRLSIRSCYFAGKLSDNAASSQGDYKKGGILGNLSDASQLVTADGTGYLALLNPDLAGIGSLPVNDPRQLPALDAARLGDLNQDGQRSLVSAENTHPADGMLTGQAYPYEIWTGFTDETGQRIPLYYAGDWYLPAP